MNDANQTHPSRDTLKAFLHGKLAEPNRLEVEQHVEQCDACCGVLQSIDHDPLVAQLRSSDTWDGAASEHGETQLIGAPIAADGLKPETVATPPELLDLGRYEIVEQLGEGGMGVVYKAHHRIMDRPVALKVISSQLVNSPVAIERFEMEVRAAAKLSHRNIVAAFDADQAGDHHFLVMEFVDGMSLAELVARRGKLSTLHSCNYAMQAAVGLQHAFEQGMVHRDIKPQNLMRTGKGTIKILDFGLARFARQQNVEAQDTGITNENASLGTPDYIAPEQARDARQADIRADIYSLGCTLYFLLTGRVPFPDGTAVEKVLAHCQEDPAPLLDLRPDVPREVAAACQKMMAKDPGDRYQTPAEVVEVLKPFGRPSESNPSATIDTTLPRPEKQQPDLARDNNIDQPDALTPLSQIDLFEAEQRQDPSPLLQTPAFAQQPKTPSSSSALARYGLPLILSGIGLIVVISAVIVFRSLNVEPVANPVTGDWVDLLEQLDVSENAVAGEWRLTDQGLTVEPAMSARIMLPYELPREYDLEVQFTRHTGIHSIAINFVAGSGQATFDMDAWSEHLAGIQNIGGQTLQQRANPSRLQLVNGRRYTALIRVRSDQVTASIDGQEVARYVGDGSDLGVMSVWQLPSPHTLGVGAYESESTFHRVRLRPAG